MGSRGEGEMGLFRSGGSDREAFSRRDEVC